MLNASFIDDFDEAVVRGLAIRPSENKIDNFILEEANKVVKRNAVDYF